MNRPLSLCCLALLVVAAGSFQAGCAQASDYGKADAIRNRVSDLLFPTSVASKPYNARFVLRFPDPDSELVLIIYPGKQSELVTYKVEGLRDQTLFQYIWDALRTNPQIRDEEIASNIRVTSKRSVVEFQKLERAVDELKNIKISPFFETRIAVDEYSDYDYWFDSGGESVHYRVHRLFQHTAQDDLVHWMTRFRETFK
jgi:hypothetical protein